MWTLGVIYCLESGGFKRAIGAARLALVALLKGLAAGYVSHLTLFVFSSRRRHTRFDCDWSSDVCSSDLEHLMKLATLQLRHRVIRSPGYPPSLSRSFEFGFSSL